MTHVPRDPMTPPMRSDDELGGREREGFLTPRDTEWWSDRLNAMHSLACDSDALPMFRNEPWRKLSAYDISRMAELLSEVEDQL